MSPNRAVIAAASFTLAVWFIPVPTLNKAAAQDNPKVSNIIPEGGHYSVTGKLQTIDPAANTLALATEKYGVLPMIIGTEAADDVYHVAVGESVDVTYTRNVAFVVAPPNVNVSNVPANATVGQVAQAGGIGPEATTVVGRITKVDANHSFDVVNANGGGVYTVVVTNPLRQQAVGTLKAGDSVTVSVGPLVATAISKCGVFGLGLVGC
jgi:hypothetical protein